MRHKILIMLVLTTGVFAVAQTVPQEADPHKGIPFEMNQRFGTILVRAQVNGRAATLVVDTGSSNTILSSDLLRVRPATLQSAGAPLKGSGYVGAGGWAKATVEIGTLKWPGRRVLVMNDFQELSKSMNQRIDGILGEDVLREFEYVGIDFKRRQLIASRH